MHGMAIHAANIVLEVLRAQEVAVLFSEFMAAQAALGSLLPRQTGEADDLGRIGRFGVFLTRPVTGLASLPLRTGMLGQVRLPMRSLVKALALLLMTGLACV